jgi:hypothetical protein
MPERKPGPPENICSTHKDQTSSHLRYRTANRKQPYWILGTSLSRIELRWPYSSILKSERIKSKRYGGWTNGNDDTGHMGRNVYLDPATAVFI